MQRTLSLVVQVTLVVMGAKEQIDQLVDAAFQFPAQISQKSEGRTGVSHELFHGQR